MSNNKEIMQGKEKQLKLLKALIDDLSVKKDYLLKANNTRETEVIQIKEVIAEGEMLENENKSLK